MTTYIKKDLAVQGTGEKMAIIFTIFIINFNQYYNDKSLKNNRFLKSRHVFGS